MNHHRDRMFQSAVVVRWSGWTFFACLVVLAGGCAAPGPAAHGAVRCGCCAGETGGPPGLSHTAAAAIAWPAADGRAPLAGTLTLYLHDPTRQSFAFGRREYGCVALDGGVFNRCATMRFDGEALWAPGSGGNHASFRDLGPRKDADGFTMYHAIDCNGRRLVWNRHSRQNVVELRQSDLDMPAPGEAGQTGIPIELGHILLLHGEERDPREHFFVKMLVVAFTKGQTVELRYEIYPLPLPR